MRKGILTRISTVFSSKPHFTCGPSKPLKEIVQRC